jgi:iron complex transport system ATP-binding protein
MLIAENIHYSIKKKNILQQIHFELLPGELLSIIGPNGAGKSTLLKILCGELQKYSGAVRFSDRELKSIKPKQLALQRAVLSQSVALSLPFKVSEVVIMGRYPHFESIPSLHDKRIAEECLELVGMSHFRDRNYLTLSGGEKQRVHLARVLAQLSGDTNDNTFKILFLDEPVNGLDLKYQYEVMKIARAWMGFNGIVVAVLHDLNLAARFADKILLLNKGQQEILDIPEKVLTKENIKKVYEVEVEVLNHAQQQSLYVHPA